jgi:mycothiol synthase
MCNRNSVSSSCPLFTNPVSSLFLRFMHERRTFQGSSFLRTPLQQISLHIMHMRLLVRILRPECEAKQWQPRVGVGCTWRRRGFAKVGPHINQVVIYWNAHTLLWSAMSLCTSVVNPEHAFPGKERKVFMAQRKMTVARRSFTGREDVLRLVDLQRASTGFAQQNDEMAYRQLEYQLRAPLLDTSQDLSLWEDQDQHLVGFGKLSDRTSGDPFDIVLRILVHPDVDTMDVSAKILTWAEGRSREIAHTGDAHAMLCMKVDENDAEQRALLEHHGFSVQRQFLMMEYSLRTPLPAPVYPPGFEFCFASRERDVEACLDVYNGSFHDHWNHHPLTLERLTYTFSDPNYCGDLNVAIKNADGIFVAFGYGVIDPEENRRTQRKVGWMLVGGTRQEYRKQGIFRSIIQYGLYQMQRAGMEAACLYVDALHSIGLPKIYEAEGFRRVGGYVTYGKLL